MRLPAGIQKVRKLLLVGGLFLGLSLAGGLGRPCLAAVLQDLEIVAAAGQTEVILHLDEKTSFKHAFLPVTPGLPARCYVDLYGTVLGPAAPTGLQVDGVRVSGVRTGSYPTKLRVVLDLNDVSSCAVDASATAPFQVRIAVHGARAAVAPSPAEPPAEPAVPATGAAVLTETTPGTDRKAGDADLSGSAPAPLAALTPAGRAGFSTWGWIRLFGARDIDEDPGEDHNLARLLGRLGGEWNKPLARGTSLKLVGSIEVDRFFYDAALAEEKTEVRLHETYLQYNRPRWDAAFGKQRVRWGKSDQLSPIDRINPQDFRQFIVQDLEERSLPSWLLRTRWYGDVFALETVIQPWFQKSELEYFDSDWALYRNLRQALLADPAVPASVKEAVRDFRTEDVEPARTPENMSAAVRISWQTAQTDFALSYQYGWETLPTITRFPVQGIDYSGDPTAAPGQLLAGAILTGESVRAEYRRQQVFGFEWETVFDPVGFRGELAHLDEVALLSSDLTSERRPVTHLVSGIDYSSASEWYLNLQGSWHYIHDFRDDILYFDEHTVSLLGEVSKTLWRGNLEVALQYHYTLTDQSSYLHPAVILKYFRNLECELGANIFSGDGDTLLGSYDHADQVYAEAKLFF